MSFRFITSVLSAGALIATLSAAPARAENRHDDLGRFLGAAATLFILGSIIENETRDHKAHKPKATVQKQHKPKTQRPVVTPSKPKVVRTPKRPPLPMNCIIGVSGHYTKGVMTKRCLDRHYRSAARLPGACRVTLRSPRGDRPAYAVRCLRDRGYTLARRN